jgi:hypothetical protein
MLGEDETTDDNEPFDPKSQIFVLEKQAEPCAHSHV